MKTVLKFVIWAGLVSICFIPLVVSSKFYFPFIVPKTVAFRVIVEVIFLAFLILAALDEKYRIKLNLITVIFAAYVLSVSLSSLLAGTFSFSFWSNNERSEGILLLLHLLAYLIVMTGFLKRFEHWLIIFKASFASSILVSLYALGQQLQVKGFLTSAGGARLTATIGNAGYVAGYLIFNIFFGLLLFVTAKKNWQKWLYALGILLQIYIVFYTQTRGALIALTLCLVAFAGYVAFTYGRHSKLAKRGSLATLAVLTLMAAFLFINKDADWVRQHSALGRITSISLEETTAQNRFMTWAGAYEGFKEKPLLGYGYENFYQVFDRYFNPKIYRKAGSIVWFDRAHSIIFDRLITGGLIGLLLYLAMLGLPLIWLWKYFIKKKDTGHYYFVPVLFTLVMAAYFLQNLFIFEALVTYIPLFTVLAFLAQFCPSFADKLFASPKPYVAGGTLAAIAFIPVILAVNVKPAATNVDFIAALAEMTTAEYQQAYGDLIEVVDRDTLGTQEYRQHLAERVASGFKASHIDQSWLAQATMKVEQEFDEQIAEKPLNARNYMMALRFLVQSYIFNVERLNKALRLLDEVEELSPTRPQIYYERGYTYFYLGKYYRDQIGDQEKAQVLFDLAVAEMQKAIDLQPMVVESYLNIVMVLFVTDKSDQIQQHLDIMDERGLNYHSVDRLERMANSAIHAENYEWTKKFYREITEIDPDNPRYWVNLALAYAYLGESEEAIRIAEFTKKFGEQHAIEADKFIENVKSGYFEK